MTPQQFLIIWALCLAFLTVAKILTEKWAREDMQVRKILHGRIYQVDGRTVVLQENGAPLMFLENYQMPCRPIGRFA